MNQSAIKTVAAILPYYREPSGRFVFQTQELLGSQTKISAPNINAARNKLKVKLHDLLRDI